MYTAIPVTLISSRPKFIRSARALTRIYEVLDRLWVYRYFKLGILARRATAHLAQLADQHESHQAASQAFRKVPSLGLWPVTSGLKFIFGYFLGGAANARRVVKNGFSACFGDVSSAPWWQTDPCR